MECAPFYEAECGLNKRPNILLVAPSAPPRLSPESIQVGRVMAELDKTASGTLVTLPAETRGWAAYDASLDVPFAHFKRLELRLPLHALSARILSSHHLARLHQPDAQFWIIPLADQVLRGLTQTPDVIYSRSYPLSAALLGCRLKQRLNIPWIMHLSDPWADSPYRALSAADNAREAECFKAADRIAVTTPILCTHYQKRYPHYAEKIFVSPNVMSEERADSPPPASGPLRIVYAGSFYGDRSPAPLIDALAQLHTIAPMAAAALQVDVYGNAQAHCLKLLQHAPQPLRYHGPVSYARAQHEQHTADVVLCIEPSLDHPLATAFLPSKVIDCLALGKPLLALTPPGSETTALCREGYGWAVDGSDSSALASTLRHLIETLPQLRQTPSKPAPERYRARAAAAELMHHIESLIA